MAGFAGRKVAILAIDGVEQSELIEPVKALKGAKGRGRRQSTQNDLLAVSEDRSEQPRRKRADKPVVVGWKLVTSRKPGNLADFCREMLKLFAQTEVHPSGVIVVGPAVLASR